VTSAEHRHVFRLHDRRIGTCACGAFQLHDVPRSQIGSTVFRLDIDSVDRIVDKKAFLRRLEGDRGPDADRAARSGFLD
jgi:hypothetical protein